MIWAKSLAPVLIALAIAGAIALLFNEASAAWWLAGCMLLFALHRTIYLANLYYWAALPRERSLPAGTGAWGMLLDRLGRHMKQAGEEREELEAELGRIRMAVDLLPDGLVVLDRYDHVEWSNRAAEELHGIFGRRRPIHHFIRQPEFVAYLEAAEYGKPIQMSLPSRPGRTYALKVNVTEEGEKLLVTRDITEQAKLDAMRRDFVANVSHEIRTPVTVIAGFAETLLELDIEGPKRHEYLETILKQSLTMRRLVEDLLMLSSLENASGPPPDETIDLHGMLRALAAEARAISQGRHTIELHLAPPTRVRAAPLELESAIRNLLTNAIRYTPGGGRLDLSCRLRADEAWISVRDTGIGIGPEHIGRLTERFYRVDRGRSRETGGTGLGLAIVKHILQRHAGRLHIESTTGLGSTFTLCLPAERIVPEPPPAAGAVPSQAASAGTSPAGTPAAAAPSAAGAPSTDAQIARPVPRQ